MIDMRSIILLILLKFIEKEAKLNGVKNVGPHK